MIPKETIDQIINAVRIEEVIGDFVQLKKVGSNYRGLSPFKNEKTPSFYVSPSKGIYKDFSTGKGGSAISFVMEHEKLSYPEALRFLAKRYNIEIKEEELTAEQIQEQNERESLLVILQYAQQFFSDYLWDTDEGKSVGLAYYRQRGFSDATIKKFKLGYHPEGRDIFAKKAIADGYKQEYLEKLGLIKNREGRIFDFFHGRVMFPILNLTGRPIGFGGRVLKSDNKEIAKYFNSPESELYNKSKTLYGIYQAKSRISLEDNCYLVEGYTDVIALHQAGIENAVASSGTSLTTEQIQLIKRFTQNITILYDGDEAGIKASFRGLNMILEAGMNVKVVLFPDGDDPDSYSRKVSNEELNNYLHANAKDFISFKTGVLLSESGSDPIKKAKVIRDIVESIALVPDAILRSSYVQTTSQLLQIQESVLITELNALRRKNASKPESNARFNDLPPDLPPDDEPPASMGDNTQVAFDFTERELVRLLINYGNSDFDYHHTDGEEVQVGRLNVLEFITSTLNADEITFENPLYQRIYQMILEEYRENPLMLANHPEDEIRELVSQLVEISYSLSENWKNKHYIFTELEEHLLETLVKDCLMAYLLKRVETEIDKHRKLIENSDSIDEQLTLIAKQKELERVKVRLSAELKRVILK
ncbi:MAG TPA: DNA primase [Luteibaculaceae bacterium]|nr:DNA primase [Luteibaculaceae bacterium]